ncbi:hypothetical protein N2152v2_009859 [Parachlorella kessleri]
MSNPPGQPPMMDPRYLAMFQALASNPQAYNPQAAAALSQIMAAQGLALPQGLAVLPGTMPAMMPQAVPLAAAHPRGQAPLPQQFVAQPQNHSLQASSGYSTRKRKERPGEGVPGPAGAPSSGPAEDEAEDGSSEEDVGAAGEPPAVDRRAAALELLKRTGVPLDRAEKALHETEEQCLDFDAAGWADEAQVWLACNNEFEDERDQLAEAMQVSLVEAEERKALEAPLEERDPDEILQAFVGSALLKALQPLCSLECLLQPPLKAQLVRYLRLEQRCGRWYSLSCHYFRQAAAECAAQLGAATAERTQGGGKGVAGQGAESAGEGQETVATAVGADAVASEAAALQSQQKPGSRRSSRHSTPVDGETDEATPAAAAAAPLRKRRAARKSQKPQQKQEQQPQVQQQEQQEGKQQQVQEQQTVPNGLEAADDASDGGEVSAAAAAADTIANGHTGPEQASLATAPAQRARCLPSRVPAAALEVVAAFISKQTAAVECEVYAMPAGDGVGVPELFVKAAEGQLEDEYVELLD